MSRCASHSRTTSTVQSKQKLKAKNPENQAVLDKLLEVQEKASSNSNSNYIFAVKRAVKSLQSCPTPITTRQEACQLKYVGPALAKIICPTQLKTPTSSCDPVVAANPTSRKRTQAASSNSVTSSNSNNNTATRVQQHGPTKKEKTYQTEKQKAESLDVSKCGPWKVILIVDGREHKSNHVVSKCKQSGIPCEERHLPIGDMTWIAQSTDKATGKLVEVLCGTIVERKESADLVHSLFGTRYLEQRLRLQNCGLPQLLFLVEGQLNSNINCSAETLEMAIMETRCCGFHVLQTQHLQDTVQKLKGLHRRIVQRTFPDAFSNELPTFTNSPTGVIGNQRRRRRRPTSLLEMRFDTPPKASLGMKRFLTYTELKAKVEMDREAGTKTIGAVYMAMLKQVSTLSHKKCEAIARQYPTVHGLMDAYTTAESPETLVRDIPMDRQKVGPKSATELFVACCTKRNGVLPGGMQHGGGGGATKKPPPKSNTIASLPVAKRPSPPASCCSSQDMPSVSQSAPDLACVDLTQESPKKPPPAHRRPVMESSEPPSPHQESDSTSTLPSSSYLQGVVATKPTTTGTSRNNINNNNNNKENNDQKRGVGGMRSKSTAKRPNAFTFEVSSPDASSPDSITFPSSSRRAEVAPSKVLWDASRQPVATATATNANKPPTPPATLMHLEDYFSSPALDSSPDSVDPQASRKVSSSSSTLLANSPLEVDLTGEFTPTDAASPMSKEEEEEDNPSILVIDDSDDESTVPNVDSGGSPHGHTACVSNSSSSGSSTVTAAAGGTNKSKSVDAVAHHSLDVDLRSRLAKRQKVETIEID